MKGIGTMVMAYNHIAHLLAPRQECESAAGIRINAAVAMILRQGHTDMEVMIIERTRDDNDPWSGNLAFPGGRVEPGEIPRQTAERETLEEVGLDLGHAKYLGWLGDITGSRLPVQVSCFVYGLNGAGSATVLNDEVFDLFWVGMEELRAKERNIIAPVSFGDMTMEVPAIRLPQPGKPVLWGLTYRLVMLFFELASKTR